MTDVTEMSERNEMIERADEVVSEKLFFNNAAHQRDIAEKMADFAASEVARERERIATDLDQILDDPSFEIVDHPGYETLREYAERLRSPKFNFPEIRPGHRDCDASFS